MKKKLWGRPVYHYQGGVGSALGHGHIQRDLYIITGVLDESMHIPLLLASIGIAITELAAVLTFCV